MARLGLDVLCGAVGEVGAAVSRASLLDASKRVTALAGEHGGLVGTCEALGLDADEVETFCAYWFGAKAEEGGAPSAKAAVTLFLLGVQVGRDL